MREKSIISSPHLFQERQLKMEVSDNDESDGSHVETNIDSSKSGAGGTLNEDLVKRISKLEEGFSQLNFIQDEIVRLDQVCGLLVLFHNYLL